MTRIGYGTLAGVLLDGPDDGEETRVKVDGEPLSVLVLAMGTNSIPLRSVDAAAAYIPFIADARKKLKEGMEAMVLQGCTSLARDVMCSFRKFPDVLIVSRTNRCLHPHYRLHIICAVYRRWWKASYVI